MASLEIVALDTVTPQLRAPGVGDDYSVPRSMVMSNNLGYYFITVAANGMTFDGINLFLKNNARTVLGAHGANPFGVSVEYRIGLGASVAAPDVGIERTAAKVLKISDGGNATASGAGCIQLPTFTVAALPTAAAAGAGGRASVSDATQTFASANFGTTVTGGGANFVPVVSDGTNWKIG